jgi:hypothetical protein
MVLEVDDAHLDRRRGYCDIRQTKVQDEEVQTEGLFTQTTTTTNIPGVLQMKVYKLTTQDNTTHNDFKWIVGEWAPELSGKDGLCSNTMYHWYHDPLLAVLLNSIHADLKDPILWEAEAAGTIMDDEGLKGGSTTMCIVKQMELPIVSTTQRVAFAILCALEACQDAEFVKWATNWLSGENRTYAATDAAYRTAARAARAACAADDATYYAARAAASAAAYATYAAADAVARAAEASKINLVKLAHIAHETY